jgi:perosamine synthetase
MIASLMPFIRKNPRLARLDFEQAVGRGQSNLFNAPQPRSRLYTSADAYWRAMLAVFSNRRYSSSDTAILERELGILHQGCAAIATPMARVGIYLVLRHLIRVGQKVVLSPYTISDVVNMVICAGGVPLFADIEEGGSCNIDPDAVANLLDSHDDIGAVLVTHFYGLFCNIEPILISCRKRGIPVIEDAAQSFGAKLKGNRAGTMGDAGIFSFGLLKNVTGFIGGAVITKDRVLESRIRSDLAKMLTFPRSMLVGKMAKAAIFDIATAKYFFDTAIYWIFRSAYFHNIKFFNNKLDTDSNPVSYRKFPGGYAYRMSGIQASIIRKQLERCERQTQERIATAQLYYNGLKDLPALKLPPMRTDGSHIYFYYPILCEQRDRLAQWMIEEFRDIQVSHHRNCASLPCFSEYQRDCPNAEYAAQSVIYLPTYPGYRQSEVEKNVEVIRHFFRGADQ